MNKFEQVLKDRQDIYKANKTIITLCNYILKLTDDEKALKKATKELKKAKKYIEHENDIDDLLRMITDINCMNIADDKSLNNQEKNRYIQGLQEVQNQYSVK
ncbi:hypothetical protein LEQ06_19180 [Paraclostridium sp. AKS46]|nr:hypothetical protein [Paraclostridium sp. AKS46]